EDEMTPDDRALLESPAAAKTWQWLAGRFAHERLSPDSDFRLDLGVDSLEWLNFTLEIRRQAGVELSEDAVARIEIVRDLLREVTEAGQSEGKTREADPLEEPEKVLGDERSRWLAPLTAVERLASHGL